MLKILIRCITRHRRENSQKVSAQLPRDLPRLSSLPIQNSRRGPHFGINFAFASSILEINKTVVNKVDVMLPSIEKYVTSLTQITGPFGSYRNTCSIRKSCYELTSEGIPTPV